jgi:hypothetical protein
MQTGEFEHRLHCTTFAFDLSAILMESNKRRKTYTAFEIQQIICIATIMLIRSIRKETFACRACLERSAQMKGDSDICVNT